MKQEASREKTPERRPLPPVFGSTLARVGFLPMGYPKGGFLQIVFPEWSYDLCAYLFFPLNWAIAAIAGRFPCAYAADDWPLDPSLAPGKLPGSVGRPGGLAEAIRRRGDDRLPDDEVWRLFDSLDPPTTNDMIGTWRGKVVFTGSWLDVAGALIEAPARALGLEWGKRFFSPYRGDPLIFIIGKSVIVPVPVWGNVTMPEIQLRGKTGAAMTYDHQPWKDHFRVLDDGKASGRRMMLGNWMSREKNGGWFTLEEIPEADAAIAGLLLRSPY